LHAFIADTGATIFGGGSGNELMAGVEKWNSAIAANGRIYVAADNKVYAFKVAAPASQLVFTKQPATAAAGQEIGGASGFTVQLADADGNTISGAGTNITVSLASGSGALLGTLTVATAANGTATFNVTNTVPGSKTILASGTGLASATSSSFNINAGSAAQLMFIQQPSLTVSNSVVAPAVTVQLQDAYGNNVATSGVTISLALTAGMDTLTGTTNVTTDANGLATFSNLIVSGFGSDNLRATSSGLSAMTSQPFTISFGGIIPAVSDWGLLAMMILMLIVASIYLSRRHRTASAGHAPDL
jgi:hypothetical protein